MARLGTLNIQDAEGNPVEIEIPATGLAVFVHLDDPRDPHVEPTQLVIAPVGDAGRVELYVKQVGPNGFWYEVARLEV